MSDEFLTNFMQFVQARTKAERTMALDLELNVHARMNVDDALLAEKDFSELLRSSIDEAINTDDIVITNNMLDDDEAPQTNVHLHNLRMVVLIPIPGHGAVYLDQRIRDGIFKRAVVERINEFGRYLVANDKTGLSPDEFGELFDE